MKNDLTRILNDIAGHSRSGNRRALSSALRELMENKTGYYHESERAGLLDAYSDALYKILLLDLDQEEEDSIEIAELAYLGLGTVLRQEEAAFDHYKRRILLMHYFSDYFTDSVIDIFLKKYRAENSLQARNLAMECIEKMQLADINFLEEHQPEYINQDEQLIDACNRIETEPDLQEQEEALLLHKILYAYLKAKYKN